jgi:hypothetical protein
MKTAILIMIILCLNTFKFQGITLNVRNQYQDNTKCTANTNYFYSFISNTGQCSTDSCTLYNITSVGAAYYEKTQSCVTEFPTLPLNYFVRKIYQNNSLGFKCQVSNNYQKEAYIVNTCIRRKINNTISIPPSTIVACTDSSVTFMTFSDDNCLVFSSNITRTIGKCSDIPSYKVFESCGDIAPPTTNSSNMLKTSILSISLILILFF